MRLAESTPSLLVRTPSWLGDLVMCEPALRALHEHYAARGAAERLTLAGPRHLLGLFDAQWPGARRAPFDGRTGELPADWRGHEVALLFNNTLRSAWTALRAGIPRRVGWSRDLRALLLTDWMVPPREAGAPPLSIGRAGAWPRWLPRPYSGACRELVQALGIAVRDLRPRLSPTTEARAAAARRLARFGLYDGARFVLVNAGGRPQSAKTAPVWLYAPALRALWERERLPLVLLCGPGEERVLETLHGRLGGVEAHPCTAPIAELPELAALCERAALVLTADGGPRHVAAAVGARLVCVCGPTDPRHSGEHAAGTRVLRAVVPCGPCHREECALPKDEALVCWRRIGDEELGRRLSEALQSS
jgi:heptosyltransferase II